MSEEYIKLAMKHYPREAEVFLPDRYDWLDVMATRSFYEKSKFYQFDGSEAFELPKRPVSDVLEILNEYMSRPYLIQARQMLIDNDSGQYDGDLPPFLSKFGAILTLFNGYMEHKSGNKFRDRGLTVRGAFYNIVGGKYSGLDDPALLADLRNNEIYMDDLEAKN